MEHPVRKQLDDYIGRRNVTLPQFIRPENMERYFAMVGVDSQREIVRGLLRCNHSNLIGNDFNKKIIHLYNNLNLLREPLRQKRNYLIDPRGNKKKKTHIIVLINETIRSMLEIEDRLRDYKNESLQAVINWTISTVNLFSDAYLKNQCEGQGLEKSKKRAEEISRQLSDILSEVLQKKTTDITKTESGLFVSKIKKIEKQKLLDQVETIRSTIGLLSTTGKLVKDIIYYITLAQRLAVSLQTKADTITADWSKYYLSSFKDDKGLPVVSVLSEPPLKAPKEIRFDDASITTLNELGQRISDYSHLLLTERERLLLCGIEEVDKFDSIIKFSIRLNDLLKILQMELHVSHNNVINRKNQIIREKINYQIEKERTDKLIKTNFIRAIEEIYPTYYKNQKSLLIEYINKGITKDQLALLRSEINFWSMLKDKLYQKGSESKQNVYIRRRRMVNEILPDEKIYIEYSDTLRKTIDISDEKIEGFDVFVQQDFHELLKYLVSIYREASGHIIHNEKTEEAGHPGSENLDIQ